MSLLGSNRSVTGLSTHCRDRGELSTPLTPTPHIRAGSGLQCVDYSPLRPKLSKGLGQDSPRDPRCTLLHLHPLRLRGSYREWWVLTILPKQGLPGNRAKVVGKRFTKVFTY